MNFFLLTACLLAVVSHGAEGKSYENLAGCPINLARDEFLHTRGQKCYQFVMHQKNHWKEARANCQSKGGDMMTIRDEMEEQFIVSVLRSFNIDGNIWIGLSDQAKEGEYRWVTGDISTYFNWSPGEPSLLHNFEDCVALRIDSGRWADHPCELLFNSYPWICEFPVQTTTTTSTRATTTTPPVVKTREPSRPKPTQPKSTHRSSGITTTKPQASSIPGVTDKEPGKDLIGK